MNEKTSLIKVDDRNKPVIDEALGNTITLWAEVPTDAESLRYRDLIRVKREAIGAFFGRAGKSPAMINLLDAWIVATRAAPSPPPDSAASGVAKGIRQTGAHQSVLPN